MLAATADTDMFIFSREIIINSSRVGLAWRQLLQLEQRSHGCVHLTCMLNLFIFWRITAAESLFSVLLYREGGAGRASDLHYEWHLLVREKYVWLHSAEALLHLPVNQAVG